MDGNNSKLRDYGKKIIIGINHFGWNENSKQTLDHIRAGAVAFYGAAVPASFFVPAFSSNL